MSREGTSHLCDTQATHESCVPSLQYLIQDLEIDQVILKAVLVSILHSIGSSGMHPFMPGNEKRGSTSRRCTLQKAAGDEDSSPGNSVCDSSSNLSASDSKARRAKPVQTPHSACGAIPGSLHSTQWNALPSGPTKHSFCFLNSSACRRYHLHFFPLLSVAQGLCECDASHKRNRNPETRPFYILLKHRFSSKWQLW